MHTRLPVVFCLGLVLAGCPKQADQAAPETPAAPEANRPTAASQVEKAEAIATARSQARGPSIARVQPDGGTADQGPAGAGATDEPTAADLPPIAPFTKMNEHIANIFAIMELHKDDCEKAATEIEAYTTRHRPEVIALSKEYEAQTNQLSDEDQARLRAWSMRAGKKMFQKSMGLMMRFHQKCPEQMKRINALVHSLSSHHDKPTK